MKNTRKKLLFITGTRADYGKLKPLMKIVESSENFELHIFVAGMHLLKIFGSTYEEVLKDNYKNVHVAYGLIHSDKMSVNLGNIVSYLTGYIGNLVPDMMIVHGDRIEALAATIVGALNNVVVSHIEGGEVSGTIDESIRHSISKFAHLHFVSNDVAKKRIVQMGEESNSIHIIGSPDIDLMLSDSLPSIEEVKKYYEIPFSEYGILLFHPVTTEYSKIGESVKTVVDAAIDSNKKFIVIYPNNDFGSEIILNEYSRFNSNNNFKVYPSMRFEYFLTLLKNCSFIIGNSSAGIRESGIYGIPTIDIGSRQNGRYHASVIKNIQKVDENYTDILSAINNVEKYKIKQMHFGEGGSAVKFMEIISNEETWKNKLQKKFVDLNDQA